MCTQLFHPIAEELLIIILIRQIKFYTYTVTSHTIQYYSQASLQCNSVQHDGVCPTKLLKQRTHYTLLITESRFIVVIQPMLTQVHNTLKAESYQNKSLLSLTIGHMHDQQAWFCHLKNF